MTKSGSRPSAANAVPLSGDATRLYAVRVFDELLMVPWIELVDAASDSEAIALAHAIHPSKRREIWDRERLVAELPEAGASSGSD